MSTEIQQKMTTIDGICKDILRGDVNGRDMLSIIDLLNEYKAILSQSADIKSEIKSILDDQTRGPAGDDYICPGCGCWTPFNHPEAHAHGDDCPAEKEWDERHDWKMRLEGILQKMG